MEENRLRRLLAAGRHAAGTMVFEFNAPGICRLLDATGVDFAVFDMEHSGFAIDGIRSLMSWARAASPPGRWMATKVDQVRHECWTVPIGMKGLPAVPQKRGHPLQVVEQRELARRVVPFARVVARHPPRQSRQRLDLNLIRPPARPDHQAVSRA